MTIITIYILLLFNFYFSKKALIIKRSSNVNVKPKLFNLQIIFFFFSYSYLNHMPSFLIFFVPFLYASTYIIPRFVDDYDKPKTDETEFYSRCVKCECSFIFCNILRFLFIFFTLFHVCLTLHTVFCCIL